MKTTLIIVSVAVVALWGGFFVGYHSGVRDTNARWQSRLRVGSDGKISLSFDEVTTSHITAINRGPDVIIRNTNISK
jgi:hypothetical protein